METLCEKFLHDRKTNQRSVCRAGFFVRPVDDHVYRSCLFRGCRTPVGWTIGTYVVAGLGTLVMLRFLFGAGEAGAYPNITRLLYNWFPADQAETVQSIVFMSGRVMGGLTPFI